MTNLQTRLDGWNELDKVAAYDVVYSCSNYGTYRTKEEAEKRKAEIEAKAVAADAWVKTARIDEVSGWNDEYGYENDSLMDLAKDILALANHQAAVIEAMREALDILCRAVKQDLTMFPEQPHKESALGIAQTALALANAPYGDGK